MVPGLAEILGERLGRPVDEWRLSCEAAFRRLQAPVAIANAASA